MMRRMMLRRANIQNQIGFPELRILIDTTTNGASKTANNQFEFSGAVGDYDVVAYQNNVEVASFQDLSGVQTITLPTANSIYQLRLTPKEINPFRALVFSVSGNTTDRGKMREIISFGTSITWTALNFEGCTFLTKISSPIYNGENLLLLPRLSTNCRNVSVLLYQSLINATDASFCFRNPTRIFDLNPRIFETNVNITNYRNWCFQTLIDPYTYSRILINLEATNQNSNVQFVDANQNPNVYYSDFSDTTMGSSKTTAQAVADLQARGWFGSFGTAQLTPTQTYEVFLAWGQSNCSGRAPINSTGAPAWIADGVVDGSKMWDGYSIVQHTMIAGLEGGNGSDVSNQFAYDAVLLKELADLGRTPLLVKYSLGGTPISRLDAPIGSWNVDFQNILFARLLQIFERRFQDFVNYCQLNNINYVVKAQIPHQGEADANDSTTYEVDRIAVENYVRNMVGNANLPVITATTFNITNINAILENIANNNVNNYLFDATTQPTLDGVHFDAVGQVNIAQWMKQIIIDNNI